MKIALVHDHLAQDGGAERVLRSLMELYPEAPVYTIVYNPREANQWFRGKDIRTSFIQNLPWSQRLYQWYLPMMPTAVERLDLTDYDVVVSDSASLGKGVITKPETLHLCYLHSPTRYLWNDTISYVNELHYAWFLRVFAMFALTRMRQWDRLAADRVDTYVVNSRLVLARLQKYYRRTGQIIHPPVQTERFSLSPQKGNYYITGGRLVPYKRFDLAIQAFNKMGLPLKIFGSGPDFHRLKKMAKPNIEFLGRVSDQEMNSLYGRAVAFINPQIEDFGIATVEAMAAGTPVIAFAAGGALEIVKDGETGVFFQDQEWESLADAVIRFKPERYQPAAIRAWAENFGVDRFKSAMKQAVDQAWQAHQSQLP